MTAKTLGRARIVFLIVVTVAVPAGLLLTARAMAYMDSQAAREAVLKILQSIPQAEPMMLEPTGLPATEAQKATILKTVTAFQDVLREKNYAGAWEQIHPETYGGWTRETWQESHEGHGEFDLSDMMDSPFGLMALGKNLELVDVRTEGAEGKAHVVASMEFPATFALRREGDQWLLDLARSDTLAAKARVGKQIDTLKGGSGNPWPLAMFMNDAKGLGELFGAFVDYSTLPLWDVTREVSAATVADGKAQITIITRGKLHLLLPLEMKAGAWDLAVSSGGGKVELVPLGSDLSAMQGVPLGGGKASQAACMSNLKQLALGMMMYCQDYDEQMPPADKWCDVLMPYVKNEAIFKCPADDGPFSYAMNYKLSKQNLSQVMSPAETIILFETEPSRKNAFDDQTGAMPGASLATPGRHDGGNNFAYADGHVRWLKDHAVTLEDFRLQRPGPAMRPGAPLPPPPPPPGTKL